MCTENIRFLLLYMGTLCNIPLLYTNPIVMYSRYPNPSMPVLSTLIGHLQNSPVYIELIPHPVGIQSALSIHTHTPWTRKFKHDYCYEILEQFPYVVQHTFKIVVLGGTNTNRAAVVMSVAIANPGTACTNGSPAPRCKQSGTQPF